MQVSVAEKKDLLAILTLQKACYIEEARRYNDYSIAPLTQSIDDIQIEYESSIFLKIDKAGEILGSVRIKLENDTCKIGRLIVDQKLRNKGFGKMLMHAAESYFQAARRFELFTGHLSIKNLSFYQKLGYQQYGKAIVNQDLTLVYLEKLISK